MSVKVGDEFRIDDDFGPTLFASVQSIAPSGAIAYTVTQQGAADVRVNVAASESAFLADGWKKSDA